MKQSIQRIQTNQHTVYYIYHQYEKNPYQYLKKTRFSYMQKKCQNDLR